MTMLLVTLSTELGITMMTKKTQVGHNTLAVLWNTHAEQQPIHQMLYYNKYNSKVHNTSSRHKSIYYNLNI